MDEGIRSPALITVIVPVYNVEKYIQEALDSLLVQTYRNLEILVIDDGSTDGSGRICDDYAEKDQRIRVIHQNNKGLSGARNTGLNAATGQMIMFLDSDDAYHPEMVKKMTETMIQENADVVFCKIKRYDQKERMDPNIPEEGSAQQGVYNRIQLLRALADRTIFSGVCNILWRRELWKEIRFPEGRVYEDIDTTFRVVNGLDKAFVLNEGLYLQRKRPGSITSTYTETNIRDYLLAKSHFESFVRSNIPGIFTERNLFNVQISTLRMLIKSYYFFCQKNKGTEFAAELRNRAIETGKIAGVHKTDYRTRTDYWTICYFPWLLRTVYRIRYRIRRTLRRIQKNKNE